MGIFRKICLTIKTVLDIKRHLLKESSASIIADYYDPAKIILDARKAFDGLVPYSGLGVNSTNDYFSSIDLIGGEIKAEEDYSDVDLSLKIGGRYSNDIVTSDVPFFISGMSYGSLKLPAKIVLHIALNKLAEDGIHVIMNTGEGGALPWEIYGSDTWNNSIMEYTNRLLKAHNLDGVDREQIFSRKYPLTGQYASGRFWRDLITC